MVARVRTPNPLPYPKLIPDFEETIDGINPAAHTCLKFFDFKRIYSLRILRRSAIGAAMYQSIESTASSMSQRFSHKRIDDLFKNPIIADKGARYANRLFQNTSTLFPYVSEPNSVKIATPLKQYVNSPLNQASFRVANHCQEAEALSLFVRHLFIYSCMEVLTSNSNRLAAQNIKINECYLISCTSSRATDLAAAATVLKEASPA